MLFNNVESIILKKQQESPAGLREHMNAVASMAMKYAKEVGYDVNNAYLAGIAHDLFRSASDKAILEMVSKAGIPLNNLMMSKPMLAHGPAAAGWLKINIPDISEDIVNAVKDHTFPDAEAPVLTQIIAVADTLEPSRNIPEREQIRLSDIPFTDRYKRVYELKLNNSKRINGLAK